MERIADFIYRRARLIIIFVVIVNVVALASFFRFGLDTDFISFFTAGNPKAVEYDRLNDKYQVGETVMVLIEQESSLLEEDNLLSVFRLQQDIEWIDGVLQVESFIPDDYPLRTNVMPVTEAFITRHQDLLEDYIRDEYFLTEQFLSADDSKGAIVVTLESDADAGKVLAALKERVRSEPNLNLSLAGNEIIKDTLWSYLVRILWILPPCAIILVLLVFYLVIRSRKFTLMALIPAGLAALWTFGTVFWCGYKLNLVTVISPIFIIVMGSADGLHYITHYMDNTAKFTDRRQLTVETLRLVGMPIFLTTITTMAGFASLTWSELLPMQHMGIFVTAGIGYAGFLSLFFLPAILSRIELPHAHRPAEESHLARLVLMASRQRMWIIASFAILVVVSAAYIPKLEVVSNQLMFFREGSEIRQTFNRVEEHFGGALPLTAEIVAERGIDTLRDYNYAEDVLDAERELERLPGIESAVSLFDMVRSINEMVTGRVDYPENPRFIQRLLTQIDEEDLATWASADGLRMMIRTEKLESLDVGRLEAFVAEHPAIRTITGMPVLFDEMNRLVVRSQAQSLGLALVLIFLMLLVTIRRLRAAFIALLPIVITIVAIMGMLTMTGFHLNVLTANLSAIAVGVGVDYAIHLISGIYYFRRQGLGRSESVDSALIVLSKPVLANAFGLAIGLSVLFFSPLRIHMQAASVMWVAMVVSSMAALLLIPIFYARRSSPEPEK
ncbi:MAG TPA: MMPL family transporter [Dehalococcoidales bacterium]|nr:MMPL family transporter [Dehalococcoidales bacterium]